MIEYSNDSVVEIIENYIHNERNRRILIRRLRDGPTFEKLAEEFGLSVRRVKTIVYEGQNIIFKHISG